MRLKLLTSSRPYALAEELVVFSWFFWNIRELRVHFRNSAEVEVQIFVPVGFFSGPIGNSEFIFRTRRNSNFRYSELGETKKKKKPEIAKVTAARAGCSRAASALFRVCI